MVIDLVVLPLLGWTIAWMARNRGRSPLWFVLLLVFGWLLVGVCVGVVAVLLTLAAAGPGPKNGELLLMFFPGYYCGAACGAGIAFLTLLIASPRQRPREDVDYDDFDPYRSP